MPPDQAHHLPVGVPVLACHQIKPTTCPWACEVLACHQIGNHLPVGM